MTDIVKEKETIKLISAQDLNAEDRKKLLAHRDKEEHEARQQMTAKMVRAAETGVGNIDLAAGGLSYAIFGYGCSCIAKGDYWTAAGAFMVAVLAAIIKHRISEGPVIKWLKQPRQVIIADVKRKAEEVRRSCIGQ